MSAYICICIVSFLAATVSASPLRGIDSQVQSDLVLVQNPFYGASPGARRPRNIGASNKEYDIPVGEALDLFYRFGFFSLSVRVVPRDDPATWLVREPTAAIFVPGSVNKDVRRNPNPTFDPDFQVYFADDEQELLKSYFGAFAAEGVERPYKLYTGSWHASTKAKYLGLSKDAFDGESSFVMVRINKRRATVSAQGQKTLRPEVLEAANQIQVGDEESVLDFMKRFGSHWISEAEVGESVYQVYALRPDQYRMAKNAALAQGAAARMSAAQFSEFQKAYLAPFAVRETGRPLAASGDRNVLGFLEKELNGEFGGSPNLLRLAEDPAKMARLEEVTDQSGADAIIGLKFNSLRMSVPGIQKMDFYDGVSHTKSALWEANI